jgi:hypothetical protein
MKIGSLIEPKLNIVFFYLMGENGNVLTLTTSHIPENQRIQKALLVNTDTRKTLNEITNPSDSEIYVLINCIFNKQEELTEKEM